MRVNHWIPVVGLALTACSAEAPPPQWAPAPVQPQPAQTQHSYGMPWAIGIPPAMRGAVPPAASASAAPVAEAAVPEAAQCLSDAGTASDCKTALEKLATSATQKDKVRDVYKKACEKKAKLLGCGAFKSTAITDADKPQMDLLMVCEGGNSESCEDVKTKSAPLMAWLSTLKTDGCKKGNTALCSNYKECKKSTPWGCTQVTGGPADSQVCGCVPKCSGGAPVAKPGDRTWPDGSKRGVFSCAP